ncbi:MAG: sodium:calcium antiporter [Acidimicrobiia bacterium]
MSLAQAVPVFAAAAAVLTLAGVQLARAGDEIAERAGLSRLFVGMLLVAGATSLPEIVTDVSAAVADAPDLAVGDLFGSSMANMAILAVVDLLHRHRVWAHVEIGHARVASVAVALTALATMGIVTPAGLTVGWVGVDTIAIAAAYAAAVAWMRRSPTGRFAGGELLPVPTGWTRPGRGALRPAVLRFVAASTVILVTAPALAYSGQSIARESGLGETFVGTALLALTTSLPELVASIAAVRIGAHDLAVGNLFGSNAFNMAALVLVDVAYTPAALLHAVDPSQATAGMGAILLMALALAALVHGTETRARRLEPDAILLLVAYAGALFAVWSVRA